MLAPACLTYIMQACGVMMRGWGVSTCPAVHTCIHVHVPPAPPLPWALSLPPPLVPYPPHLTPHLTPHLPRPTTSCTCRAHRLCAQSELRDTQAQLKDAQRRASAPGNGAAPGCGASGGPRTVQCGIMCPCRPYPGPTELDAKTDAELRALLRSAGRPTFGFETRAQLLRTARVGGWVAGRTRGPHEGCEGVGVCVVVVGGAGGGRGRRQPVWLLQGSLAVARRLDPPPTQRRPTPCGSPTNMQGHARPAA